MMSEIDEYTHKLIMAAVLKKLPPEAGLTTREYNLIAIKLTGGPKGSDAEPCAPPRKDLHWDQKIRNIVSHENEKDPFFKTLGKRKGLVLCNTEKSLKELEQNKQNLLSLFPAIFEDINSMESEIVNIAKGALKNKILKKSKSDKSQGKQIGEYTFFEGKLKPKKSNKKKKSSRNFKARKGIDYAKIAKENKDIGDKGEELVTAFERQRLRDLGKFDLAEKVENVSKTKGDGLGYDIDSFEENGSPKLIEVKTTDNGLNTDIIVTPNEIERSKVDADKYYICRVNIDELSKEVEYTFTKGSLEEMFDLEPIISSYKAIPKSVNSNPV